MQRRCESFVGIKIYDYIAAGMASISQTILFDLGFGSFSVLLIGTIFFLLLREHARRRESQGQLVEARNELEARVLERTAQLAKAKETVQAEAAEHKRSGRSAYPVTSSASEPPTPWRTTASGSRRSTKQRFSRSSID
jgi:C4-dicarboxylate-specific signal transduction histidine kinase